MHWTIPELKSSRLPMTVGFRKVGSHGSADRSTITCSVPMRIGNPDVLQLSYGDAMNSKALVMPRYVLWVSVA